MASIYGYTELAQALADASQRQLSIRMAEDMLYRAWQMNQWAGVTDAAAEYGVNAVVDSLGNPLYYTYETIEGVSSTAAELTYTTLTDAAIDTATNEVVISEAAQVVTEGGATTLIKGGLNAAVKALPLVGAIATGVGLGWESYQEHPDVWTDLSEAIFNSAESKDTPIEVIARAHAGGYTTAVKEENMVKILQGLADAGCFDYREYDSTITGEGMQDVTWSAISPRGSSCGLAYAKGMEDRPGWKCIQIEPDWLTSVNKWRGMAFFTDPDTLPDRVNVTKLIDASGGYVYAYYPIFCYAVLADVDADTATVSYTTYNSNYTIFSGINHEDSTRINIGGLSVNVTEIEGDNDLFPNSHTENVLMLPPNASSTDIIDAVRDKFALWFNNSWEQPEYDPETDSIVNKRYYPVTVPWWDYESSSKDPTYDQDAAQEGDIKPQTDPKAQEQAKELTQTKPADMTPSPVPVVPPDPTPGFTALTDDTSQALWSVYNPTLSELNQLGAYLWSSNIIDILQKFLQNPMDAIISLHKIFVSPTTGARKNIALGYLDSGVAADTVTKQFIDLDCGTVNVPEYFEDARDYDMPYTEVLCYLPFVGMMHFKTSDIIGGKVNIQYTIDTYSGACLAKVYVTKLGAKQLLYVYAGNCSMQIPLTGSDRTRLLSGAVAGAVAGAAAGGYVGAAVGAIGGAWKGGTSIERTSGFSANAGAMGVKKPYLLITRKYAYDAGAYNEFYGYPINVSIVLSSCKGFTRVKSTHIESIGRATSTEKAEIETLLKQGVIIN